MSCKQAVGAPAGGVGARCSRAPGPESGVSPGIGGGRRTNEGLKRSPFAADQVHVDRLWKWALVVGGLGAAMFPLLPTQSAHVWGVAWPALVTIVLAFAVRARQPMRPGAWRLLVGGCIAFTLMFAVGTPVHGGHVSAQRAAIGNLLFLAAYLLIVTGTVSFVRSRVGRRDRAGFLDGAIVGSAVAVALWQLVSQPALVHHRTHDVLGAATFPIFSAFSLAMAVRLAFANGRRLMPIWLFLAAAMLDTLSNATVATQGHTLLAPPPHSWVGSAWLMNFVLLAAAALHPRMSELGERATETELEQSNGRLAVLASALLVAPAIVIFDSRSRLTGALAAIGALALVGLVILRLNGLVRQWESARGDADRRAALQAALVGLGRMALHEAKLERVFAEATLLVNRSVGATMMISRGDDAVEPTEQPALEFDLGDEYRVEFSDVGELSADQLTFLEAVTLVLNAAVERHRADEEIRFRALHDPLTGLANRGLLREHLTTAAARQERTGTQLAVLFVDLDEFKAVNDSFGHAVGDELLVRVAGRLSAAVRAQDTVARLAGDEFVVMCEGIADEEAAEIADRIQAAIAEPIPLLGTPVQVKASIGIAVTGPGADPDTLLQRADEAMYRCKRSPVSDYSAVRL